MSELASVQPDGPVYRVAREPDPWAWPDWAYAGPDGTFGNRYDDPAASYRVLYACSQRMGAFVETLARFRPDLEVLAELDAIEGDAEHAAGLPHAWLHNRRIGQATLRGQFADAGDARSLAKLRKALAASAIHFGLDEIDAATIRLKAPRAFTQEVSRFVYERREEHGPFRAFVTARGWAISSSTGPSSNQPTRGACSWQLRLRQSRRTTAISWPRWTS